MDRLLVLALLMTLFSCDALRAGCSTFPAAADEAKEPASSPSQSDRLRVALDAAARSVGHALAVLNAVDAPGSRSRTVAPFAAGISSSRALAAAAREDCAELLAESLHLLAGASAPGAARDDGMAWLSAALTHHDTCADSLAEAGVFLGAGEGAPSAVAKATGW